MLVLGMVRPNCWRGQRRTGRRETKHETARFPGLSQFLVVLRRQAASTNQSKGGYSDLVDLLHCEEKKTDQVIPVWGHGGLKRGGEFRLVEPRKLP